MFRQTARPQRKHALIERGIAVGEDIVRDIPLAFERRVEHRIVAIAHQIPEKIEHRDFRVVGRHAGKCHFDPGHLRLKRKCRDSGFGLRRLLHAWPHGQFGGRERAKARFNRLHQGGGIKVADRDKNHVVGHVPGVENPQHVLAAQFRHRFLRANDRAAIGVLGERQLKETFGNFTVGIVLAAPEFFEDNFFFSCQFIGVKKRMQHRVTEHVEAGFPKSARQRHMVDGLIITRPGVDGATSRLNQRSDFTIGKAFGAFKEHVLKHMRNTRHHRSLVSTAKTYPSLHGHNGRVMVLQEHHAQAIGQGAHIGLKTTALGKTTAASVYCSCFHMIYDLRTGRV